MIIHADVPEAIYENYPKEDAENSNKIAKLMLFGLVTTVCFVAPSIDV